MIGTANNLQRLLFLAVFWLPVVVSAQEPAPLRVGAILPLSGADSRAGELAARGIRFALDELGAQGGVEVFFEDNRSEATQAVSAYSQLRSVHAVDAILALGSPSAMALSSIMNRDKVVMLAMASSPAYSSPDDFTFRIAGSGKMEADFAAALLQQARKGARIGLLYSENDYGFGVANAFKSAWSMHGQAAAEESFVPGTRDFRTQLLRLRQAHPDIIFLGVWAVEAAEILKQAKSLKLTQPFLSGPAAYNPDLFAAGGAAADGLYTIVPQDEPAGAVGARYREKFSEAPMFQTLRMYDSMRILSAGAPQCTKSAGRGDCLRAFIAALHDFPGSSLAISFDRNGDIREHFILKQARQGRFVRVDRLKLEK